MIEVFKTNVNTRKKANLLLEQIHSQFAAYQANFDLDDCDRILRIKSTNGCVEPSRLIHLLQDFGVAAEVLAD